MKATSKQVGFIRSLMVEKGHAHSSGSLRGSSKSLPHGPSMREGAGSVDEMKARTAANPVNTVPHLIVKARAGTGKTTTLVEGLRVVRGLDPRITPSAQQRAIWDELERSKGCGTVQFVAFNKSIATELQQRVPAGCNASTMHSMGYKAVQVALGRQAPNEWVVEDIIADIVGGDLRDIKRKNPVLVGAVKQLVGLCKMNLVLGDAEVAKEYGPAAGLQTIGADELDPLCSHYEVELNGSRDRVYDLVPQVLTRCLDPRGKISFDDMIWLPVVLNLPVPKSDLLLVDEAQDLNRCQQELAKRAGRRLVFVGDDRQAIYGFAGADAESLSRLERELTDTPVGCTILPLTMTRRCGRAIVDEARKIVPDFEAHESNGTGSVRHMTEDTYPSAAEPGDMIVCRVNAPLVSNCFRFIRAGRKANIIGRDVAAGLIRTIKSLDAATVVGLISRLGDWLDREQRKEQAKKYPSESRMIALQDRHDCILCFTQGLDPAASPAAVIDKVESIFTDDRNPGPAVRFSSVHKAKGLEAKRVFVLLPDWASMPHPMARSAWQIGQEYNCLYVALTRAIEELVYVR